MCPDLFVDDDNHVTISKTKMPLLGTLGGCITSMNSGSQFAKLLVWLFIPHLVQSSSETSQGDARVQVVADADELRGWPEGEGRKWAFRGGRPLLEMTPWVTLCSYQSQCKHQDSRAPMSRVSSRVRPATFAPSCRQLAICFPSCVSKT